MTFRAIPGILGDVRDGSGLFRGVSGDFWAFQQAIGGVMELSGDFREFEWGSQRIDPMQVDFKCD